MNFQIILIFLLLSICTVLRSDEIAGYNQISAIADAKSNDMGKIKKACEYGVKNENSEIVNLLITNNKYSSRYSVRIQLFKSLLTSNNEFISKALIFLFKDDELWFKKEEYIGELRASKSTYEEKLNGLLLKCLKGDYGTKYDFDTLESRKKILVELEQALASYIKAKENKEVYNQISAFADAKSKSLAKIEDACVYATKNEDSLVINHLLSNKEYGDKHELRAQLFQTLSTGSNEFILKTLIFLFKDDDLWIKYEEKVNPNDYTKELSEEKLNYLLAKCLKNDVDKNYTFDSKESRKKILTELEKVLVSYTIEKKNK